MTQLALTQSRAKTEVPARSLRGDQRGAMMVMGIFMAMLMVGFIYYVSGIGQAIMFRERMQDASDAGAWAASVVHARGMNGLVLIHMIMAAFTAVLIALNMLVVLLKAAIVIGEVLSCFPLTSALGAGILSVANPLKESVETVRDAVKETVEDVLPVLTRAARTLAKVVPWLAEAKVVVVAANDYGETVEFGIFYGRTLTHSSLPVEDDRCERIEEEAERYVRDLAMKPFGSGVLADIADKVVGLLSDAASYTEGGTCGGSDGFGGSSLPQSTQILGEQCMNEPTVEFGHLQDCIGIGSALCGGNTSSGTYPHYWGQEQYDAYHEACGPMANHNCEEIAHCAEGLHNALEEDATPSTDGTLDGGADIAPQRVRADAYLGDAWFQLRTVMLARSGQLDVGLHNARLGNWGRSVPEGQVDVVEFLTNVGFAQGEFYYNDNAAHTLRDDWMWHQRWQARMRRFSLGDTSMMTDACSTVGAGGVCNQFEQVSSSLRELIVH